MTDYRHAQLDRRSMDSKAEEFNSVENMSNSNDLSIKLKCCSCQRSGENVEQGFVLLQCLHCICVDCFREHSRYDACTTCATPNRVNAADIYNKFIYLVSYDVRQRCRSCNNVPVIVFCLDCKLFMCNVCETAHRRNEETSAHLIGQICHDRGENGARREDEPNAPDEIALVDRCHLSEHLSESYLNENHKEVDYAELDAMNTSEMVAQLALLEDTRRRILKTKDDAVFELQHLHDQEMGAENKIRATFDSYKRILEERKLQLVKQIQKHREDQLNVLNCQKLAIHEYNEKLKHFILTKEPHSTQTHTGDICFDSSTKESSLEDLVSRRQDRNVYPLADLEYKSSPTESSFKKSLQSLGCIKSLDADLAKTEVDVFDGVANQTYEVMRVRLYDQNHKQYFEGRTDVQAQIFTSSGTPVTGFLESCYIDTQRHFSFLFKTELTGDFYVSLFVCGKELGKKLTFKIKQNSLVITVEETS
ncbi:hypothetical protein ACJMK2_026371 [Sinanodonta woodiana]|uniref:B box-type domain-containing protein n=1 Tax=Sinanodonta woodiana TaxID=1069815 RepID=A0ABD3XMX7_SINWO